jgi:peptidoglycan L-alanyl-D-glutamate endopeptidase CwlK
VAANLGTLVPEFRSKVEELISECAKRDVEIRPFCTLRTPAEQARLYRQSRSSAQVDQAIQMLRDKRASFLASILEGVGPQHGKPVTNAIPGNSWHQWGEAVDMMVIVDGNAEWNDLSGYAVMADVAIGLDLTAGYFWKFQDNVASPIGLMQWHEIDYEMSRRFGANGGYIHRT